MVINPANFRFIQPDKFILTVRNPGFDMMLCFFIYQLLVYGNGIHTWIVPFLLLDTLNDLHLFFCFLAASSAASLGFLFPKQLFPLLGIYQFFHLFRCPGQCHRTFLPFLQNPLFFHVADNRPDLKPGHIQTGTDITDLLHLVFCQFSRNQFTLLRLRQGRLFYFFYQLLHLIRLCIFIIFI